MNKKAKPLTALAVLAGVAVIGGTAAMFFTDVTVKNIFSTAPYNATIYENFTSPQNWLPGTVTPKEVFVKNEESGKIIVRIGFKESWVSSDGKILPNILIFKNGKWTNDLGADCSEWVDEDALDFLPEENSKLELAVKSFGFVCTDGDDSVLSAKNNENAFWVYDKDGYYYYRFPLEKGAVTKNFLNSVRFNPAASCGATSAGNSGYSNAKYTLTIKAEVLNASRNAMENVWNHSVSQNRGGADILYENLPQ